MKNKQNGFSLTELLLVVVIIGIIAAIAVPNLLASKRAANEASAIATIRTLSSAESTYSVTVGNRNYGTLTQLGAGGLIDWVIGCTTSVCTKSGYNFSVDVFDNVPNVSPAYYDARAIPVNWSLSMNSSGSRSFYLNEVGTIFFTLTGTAPSGTNSVTRLPSTGSPLS